MSQNRVSTRSKFDKNTADTLPQMMLIGHIAASAEIIVDTLSTFPPYSMNWLLWEDIHKKGHKNVKLENRSLSARVAHGFLMINSGRASVVNSQVVLIVTPIIRRRAIIPDYNDLFWGYFTFLLYFYFVRILASSADSKLRIVPKWPSPES